MIIIHFYKFSPLSNYNRTQFTAPSAEHTCTYDVLRMSRGKNKQNTHSDVFHLYYKEASQHSGDGIVNTESGMKAPDSLEQKTRALQKLPFVHLFLNTHSPLKSAALSADVQWGNEEVNISGVLKLTSYFWPRWRHR